MVKLLSLSLMLFWAFISIAPVQARTITGTVTNAANGKKLAGVSISAKGTKIQTRTDKEGKYAITFPEKNQVLVFTLNGYTTKEVKPGTENVLNVKLTVIPVIVKKEETVSQEIRDKKAEEPLIGPEKVGETLSSQEISKLPTRDVSTISSQTSGVHSSDDGRGVSIRGTRNSSTSYYVNGVKQLSPGYSPPQFNTEGYDAIRENGFLEATKNPLSTFSIDVDNASYSNVRRFLNSGQAPPKDAVRIEEMVNYFRYTYPQPADNAPFSVTTELASCPWNKENILLHVGLKGKEIATDDLPPSNLVFLIDVSGSMMDMNKLPLVKAGFKMLVEKLRAQDKVAVVVYAGAAGLVLKPTRGNQKEDILAALDRLEAGGSTAGGAGINLAYKVAQENFLKGGNNRVILATDGDFNIGVSSDAEMERLIEEKRETGIFLTVLGFGTGNLKDSKMKKIADKGNGNYAYIDNTSEARKVFVNEFGGTLFTIAKDVKLQLEFNPAKVKAYRLVGYENRALRNEDFNNDKKDAGDMGAGHTVTALYEIMPANKKSSTKIPDVDPLKYQQNNLAPDAINSAELVTLKLRYKEPESNKSKLIETTVKDNLLAENQTSENFRFSASVAQFGMLLRDSEFKGKANFGEVIEMAKNAKGNDDDGHRAEFINLVRSAKSMYGPDKKVKE